METYYWRVAAWGGWASSRYGDAFTFSTLVGSLSVRVVDVAGRNLQDARIELFDSAGNRIRVGTTDAKGGIAFTDLPLGVYEVRASLSGYGEALDTVTVSVYDRAPEVRVVLAARTAASVPPWPWVGTVVFFAGLLLAIGVRLGRRAEKG